MIDNDDITKKDLGIKRFALKQIWFEKIQHKSNSQFKRTMKKEFNLNSQFTTFIEPRKI